MASQRVGEASNLSGSGHHNTMSYAVFHGLNPPTTSFMNQEVSGFHFGELEEAILLQGVKNITNDDAKTSLYASAAGARPAATLEMFPSWPTRLLQTTSGSTPKSGENSTSDSGINTISSSRGLQMDEFLEQESPMSKNTSSSADQYSLLQPAPADDHNNNKHFQMSQSAVVVHHHQPLDILANDNNVPISSDFPQTTTHQTSTAAKPTNDKKRGPGSTSSKVLDAKTLRRLAQNREAARKSRLRKKAYVQQLETSRIRLAHIEQDLQRARAQQGLLLGGGGVAVGNNSSGAAMFDMEYARWLDDDNRHMSELRNALHVQLPDGDLRMVVDGYVAHYDEIFRLKGAAAKADIFHLITGMWSTPAERCFLWMGGFRPSELIKMLIVQLDPLTEQQVVGIYSLQHSSQQAEEALSQGLEQLQHSLIETIANGTINSDGMHHMVIALGKLTNLEGFVRQADNLRQQTLHQLRRILTVRQAARCFLAIGEYYSRLRALSSLWASRPRETMLGDEGSSQTTSELQMMQSSQNQFSNF